MFGGVFFLTAPAAPGHPSAAAPPAAPAPAAMATPEVYYAGCNEVRALGKAPLYSDQPGYRIEMDGDHDGIACEPHRDEID